MAELRVVLHTNVLVSGLAYPRSLPGKIMAAWQRGAVDVVLSRYILDELQRVLPRLRQVQLTAVEIRDLADSLLFMADVIEPNAQDDPLLRDPDDQPILAALRASGAHYLLTGDKDLLALSDRYPIMTPAEFWNRHGE